MRKCKFKPNIGILLGLWAIFLSLFYFSFPYAQKNIVERPFPTDIASGVHVVIDAILANAAYVSLVFVFLIPAYLIYRLIDWLRHRNVPVTVETTDAPNTIDTKLDIITTTLASLTESINNLITEIREERRNKSN
jgi:hypothetical protein